MSEILSIRINDNLKKDFDNICNELGFSMTTAINIFVKKVIREKRLPFEVALDPFYTSSNIAVLNESINQMKQGKIVSRTFKELDASVDE